MTDIQILARQILEVVPSVMRTLSADMRNSGHLLSPSQFGVMLTLLQHPCNLSSLAEEQGVSLPTMSSTINTLEHRGWVKRSRSSRDRRVVNIELTDSGIRRLTVIRDHAESSLAELMGRTTQEERDSLEAGLSVFRKIFGVSDGFQKGDEC